MNAPAPTLAPGRIGQAASFDGKNFIQFGGDVAGFDSYGAGRGAIGANDPTVTYDDGYTMAAWIYPTSPNGAIVTRDEDIVEPNGHGFNLRDGRIEYDYVTKWVDEGIRLRTQKTISLNEWHHVALTYTGSRWASGVKIYVDGEDQALEIMLDDVNSQGAVKREPLRIGAGGGPDNRFRGSLDDVRIYNRALSPAEAGMLADLTTVTDIAAMPEDKRSAAQADKIRDYFLEHALPANLAEARSHLADAQTKRDNFYQSLPTVMVMEEMPIPRETHLLIRGMYDRPGEVVTPRLPAALTSSPTAFPPNRLGLARWLVDPSNPLMARVTVNRFWQMYFSTGIVKTAEDFGSQGEVPSHPELLDWLATEFVRTGWDVKALQKTIVTSATYRQSSHASSELRAKDPDNRLLARGPSARLSADIVRDQALAVSGLLVNKIGGRLGEAVPAGRTVERNRRRRGLRAGSRRQPVSPQSVYLLEALDSSALDGELRCLGAREPHGQTGAHQHAASGARPHERRDIRRGGASVRRARDEGRRHVALRANRLRIPNGDRTHAQEVRKRRCSRMRSSTTSSCSSRSLTRH